MSRHPRHACDRAPAGRFCTRGLHHPGDCLTVALASAPLDRIDSQPVSAMDAQHVEADLGETVQSLRPVVTPGGPPIDMSRTPCPPAISPADPRVLTCCLAIEETTGRVCHDTKGHETPHDWEPAPSEED